MNDDTYILYLYSIIFNLIVLRNKYIETKNQLFFTIHNIN